MSISQNSRKSSPSKERKYLAPLDGRDLLYLLIELKSQRDKIIIARYGTRPPTGISSTVYRNTMKGINDDINELIFDVHQSFTSRNAGR